MSSVSPIPYPSGKINRSFSSNGQDELTNRHLPYQRRRQRLGSLSLNTSLQNSSTNDNESSMSGNDNSTLSLINLKAPSDNKIISSPVNGTISTGDFSPSINITRRVSQSVPQSPIIPSPLGPKSSTPRSSVVETKYISLEYDPIKKRKLLNTYEIVGDLGAGQHGKVKLAIDTLTGDKVAVKILDRTGRSKVGGHTINNKHYQNEIDPLTKSPETLSENELKIRKEIAIMKKCDHENIVKLREVIDDHKLRKIYLVLEYLEKGEISWQIEDLTDNGKVKTCPVLSFHEASIVFKDVLLGVEYLHYQGIIHRDIKPANLLISKDNIIKISDFGVSFSITLMENNEYDLCKTAGTPAFYAPELCSLDANSSRLVSHKIDIWAMGVTLYCLMFGKLPFNGINGFELFERINKDKVIIPTFEEFKNFEISQNEYVTEFEYNELIDILQKLLTKDPRKRIDIEEIKQHLFVQNVLESQEDRFKFDNNLALHYHQNDIENDYNNCEDYHIEITQEEMGNAITDIGTRIKSGLSKVLHIAGLSSSSVPSLNSKRSMHSINDVPNSPGIGSHRHRLSISNIFSKKNDSPSSSSISSRKNSRRNTIYTPPYVQSLTHQDSTLSFQSDLSNNSNNNNTNDTTELYYHNNLTGSSFNSPSSQSVDIMNHSQDYFGRSSNNDDNNGTSISSTFGKVFSHKSISQLSLKSREGSQLHLNLKNISLINDDNNINHKRSISSGSTQLSDTCIEAGFFKPRKPVATTLNGIIEKNNQRSPSNSPIIKDLSAFKVNTKSRNNSILNGCHNNRISLPRKNSNVSIPANSSYASLNSIEDEFLYPNHNNHSVDRVIGYTTPNQGSTIPHNVSGFLNLNNDGNKFKFDETAKERIYGKKNKDFFSYNIKESMNKPTRLKAVSTTDNEEKEITFKVPSVTTINEIHQTKFNLDSYSDDDSDNDSDYNSEDDDLLHFSASRLNDKSGMFSLGGSSSGANDSEEDDDDEKVDDYEDEVYDDDNTTTNELKLVDSVVTVPNSLISKLNSADNSKQASQSQLFPNSPRNNNGKFPNRNPKFQFNDDDESDSELEIEFNKSRFVNPDLLKQKLQSSSLYKNTLNDEDSDDDQELILSFSSRKSS